MSRDEILVVQERFYLSPHWKLPGIAGCSYFMRGGGVSNIEGVYTVGKLLINLNHYKSMPGTIDTMFVNKKISEYI